MLFKRGDHLGDAHLDPEVDHFVAVVGEDDVDQVFPDVVDITLDGCEHHLALAALVVLFHVWLKLGDGGLHCLG